MIPYSKDRAMAGASLVFFILSLKSWSFGQGQSSLALSEESLQEFEVN